MGGGHRKAVLIGLTSAFCGILAALSVVSSCNAASDRAAAADGAGFAANQKADGPESPVGGGVRGYWGCADLDDWYDPAGQKCYKDSGKYLKDTRPRSEAIPRPVYQNPQFIDKRRMEGHMPTYPGQAQESNMEATVVARLTFKPDGRIGETKFLRSTKIFEPSISEALASWRLAPFEVDGVPVSTYTLYKFVFRMD